MRSCPWPLAFLLASLLAGCTLFDPSREVSGLKNATPAELDDESVQIYQAFLERPLDDEFLGQGLWLAADQRVLDSERHAVLEENGLRVGQFAGAMPERLLELLQSKRACIDSKTHKVRCGETTTHLLGPVRARSMFHTVLAGKREEVTFQQAQYCLDMTVTLSRDQRIEFNFMPRVRHRGAETPALTLAADHFGWKVGRSFPLLGWRLSADPGQTLLIGAHGEKTGSFGYRAFVQEDSAGAVQHVLVVRADRATVMPRSTLHGTKGFTARSQE